MKVFFRLHTELMKAKQVSRGQNCHKANLKGTNTGPENRRELVFEVVTGKEKKWVFLFTGSQR